IEEFVNLRGIPLRLMDTAGIRETDDIVEKIGVERSQQMVTKADLTLFMLNNNDELTDDDRTIFELLNNHPYIVIINKTDLENKLNIDEVKKLAKENQIISLSLKE